MRSVTNLQLILRELTLSTLAPKLNRTIDEPSQFVGMHLHCSTCYPAEEHLKPFGYAIDPDDGKEKLVCIAWRLCLN